MAKSRSKALPPEQVLEVDEAGTVREVHDPDKHVGIDHGATGDYVYHDAPAGHAKAKDRTVNIDGQTYEHCADDQDGVWLYRRLG